MIRTGGERLNSVRPAPDKGKSKKTPGGAPETNEYYERVARHFRSAKHVSIFATIVFLLAAIATSRSELTIENLQYLMKFISFTNTETSITATRITYPSSDRTRLELFIGDLCYLSPEGYALYDSRGNTIMTENIKYAFPMLSTGSKYALCYDLGGTTFTVFNTFAKLSSGTVDYPITAADISDAGNFVVASSTREYRTAVMLYDSDLKLLSRVLRENYLSDVTLKRDGSEVAVMTAGSVDGEFVTTIELIVPGHDSVRKSVNFSGLGYSIHYMDNAIAVVYDSGIIFYDSDLTLIRAVKDMSLVMTDVSDRYLTCIDASGVIGNSYAVTVYDTKGQVKATADLDGKLIGADHDESGEYIFLLAGNTVTRINLENRRIGQVKADASGFDIVAMSPDSYLIATSSYALTCTPDDFGEKYLDDSAAPADTGDAEPVTPPVTPDTAATETTSLPETGIPDDTDGQDTAETTPAT